MDRTTIENDMIVTRGKGYLCVRGPLTPRCFYCSQPRKKEDLTSLRGHTTRWANGLVEHQHGPSEYVCRQCLEKKFAEGKGTVTQMLLLTNIKQGRNQPK